MTQLSQHFSLEELSASEYAARHGIDNTPPPFALEHLKATAQQMEAVRALLSLPIHVTSGYRCGALNRAIGGAPNSAHRDGWAVDFVCPRFGSPFTVAQEIARHAIAFDQLILEYGWVHISFDPRRRRQTLTKKSAAAPYLAGLRPG